MRVNLNKTMRMSELPDYAKDLLYECRLDSDKDVPKEEYLSHYHIIIINGIVYIDDDDHANRLLKSVLFEKSSSRALMISYAVIMDYKEKKQVYIDKITNRLNGKFLEALRKLYDIMANLE